MLQKVDLIPERCGTWYTKRLSFKDRPNEYFTVRHQDPIEAIKGLWGILPLLKILYISLLNYSKARNKRRRRGCSQKCGLVDFGMQHRYVPNMLFFSSADNLHRKPYLREEPYLL